MPRAGQPKKSRLNPRPPGVTVRVRATANSLPPGANALIHSLAERCDQSGLKWTQFTHAGLPPTVNHMYRHTRYNTRLTEEATYYRRAVMMELLANPQKIIGLGHTAAVILLYSPLWVTQMRQVREMDADNRIKALLDAVQHATAHRDEMHWEIHVYKVLSPLSKTQVFLFDLGSVIDYHQGKVNP